MPVVRKNYQLEADGFNVKKQVKRFQASPESQADGFTMVKHVIKGQTPSQSTVSGGHATAVPHLTANGVSMAPPTWISNQYHHPHHHHHHHHHHAAPWLVPHTPIQPPVAPTGPHSAATVTNVYNEHFVVANNGGHGGQGGNQQ